MKKLSYRGATLSCLRLDVILARDRFKPGEMGAQSALLPTVLRASGDNVVTKMVAAFRKLKALQGSDAFWPLGPAYSACILLPQSLALSPIHDCYACTRMPGVSLCGPTWP